MSRLREVVDQFYSGNYLAPKMHGTAAIGCAAIAELNEVATSVNEITDATAGYSGGFLVLTAITGIHAAVRRHRNEY